ncbi:hypothetical protein LTR12_011828 [Friedmanniomyces endolithicus]|nr:hypothetical protein LTR12_011828 [Friedmanniomyces endolithicus]
MLHNHPGSSLIKRLFDPNHHLSISTYPYHTIHNIAASTAAPATRAPRGFCAAAALVVCVAGLDVEALAAATEVAALVLLATGVGVCFRSDVSSAWRGGGAYTTPARVAEEAWLVAAPDPEVARVVLAAAGLEDVAAAAAEEPLEACEEVAAEVAGTTGTTTGAEEADADFEEDTGAAEAAEEEAAFADVADDADAADDLDEADGATVVERGATGTSTETVLVWEALYAISSANQHGRCDFDAELPETLAAATDADEAGLEVDGAEHEAPAWGWPSTYSQMATPLAVAEVVVAAKAAVARKRRAVIVRVMVAVA